MTDLFDDASARPSLPQPQRERWQPLRIGLVELFHYDSEEFWFHDGHLLLRGNNGTGKSKVLSLTLPFLFDAQLRSSRIEPDGDNSKKMAWNLLVNGYPRRMGYAWIEFGRLTAQGEARYLTLGAGLSAVAGKAQVDSWFFVLEGLDGKADPRIGEDLWLTSPQRVVLTRERLREAVEGRGQVFESAQSYRRAVDERLFQLGARRYEALMDTLIQLRQPQLSKKPDEASLSQALTEALPPMQAELLADVAEALNQLEEDRIQLEEARQLEQAVRHFEQRYRRYAGMLARRQARELRQAQTGFDNASEERKQALAALQQASDAEAAAIDGHETARRRLAQASERLETLQSDPANQDANRLGQAEKDAHDRSSDASQVSGQRNDARQKLLQESARGDARRRRAEEALSELSVGRERCAAAAGSAGLAPALAEHPLASLAPEALAELSPSQLALASQALREAIHQRRQDIAQLQRRHSEVENRKTALVAQQEQAEECRTELEEAMAQRAEADRQAERAAEGLIGAWSDYCASLVQLRFDDSQALPQLVAWAARPEGENPIQVALAHAHREVLLRQAAWQSELERLCDAQRQRRAELVEERERLAAGEDAFPLAPVTRAAGVREQRLGAPLWQLVDFQPHLDSGARAGLEAALEASGLLDAWLAPDGVLTDAAGAPLLDSAWVRRPLVAGDSLAAVLQPAVPEGSEVAAETVMALLGGVAQGTHDAVVAETWLSTDGRFRLGALAGAWHKPEAIYIGHTARLRARARRMEEIAAQLVLLEGEAAELAQRFDQLADARRQAENEWQTAPSDRSLLAAILAAAGAGRVVDKARQRLEQADARCREAAAALQALFEQLRRDAADLQLPDEPQRLPAVAEALEAFVEAQGQLVLAARGWQQAWSESMEQQQRLADAQDTLAQREAALTLAEERAETARARYQVLRESIGQQVEALRQKLAEAGAERRQAAQAVEAEETRRRHAGERRAIADTQATQAQTVLTERIATRLEAIGRLRRFADSGLLASALPELELPESWTIDPALQLARDAERALEQIADDEAAWARIQRQISEDLTELQRALSALGHLATSEPNDWGFTVHIQYQNRPERPDSLAALLADDIAQRSELLTAKEREVLENHLQAEIAAEIQRLMRAADTRVTAINAELHKRPTSTGVRYRLQWQPLTPEEGAPAGLDIARERLLHTSSDLWSVEDRRVVGTMLQQQIVSERARADAEVTSAGGGLIDQLARALDYRHWHRFRVQRLQDGQWRKLSGPASSGERALGLTVPLFAAISSFYGSGGSVLAPRLMLLDEAFAGIDDAARAHCMGLIRQFDLDFVITSEREWACYAELPGVAICQLQRREGIDAVFVSRWNWDGRDKRAEDDPDRRFPPP